MSSPAQMLESFAGLSAIQQTRWGGPAAIERARSTRVDALIRDARERSSWFRERCAGLPADAGLDRMPVTHKAELMSRFDDWVTDPQVTRRGLAAFLADRSRIGERYLGRYAAWRGSGTSGQPGFFVHDAHACAVYDALLGAVLQSPPVSVALGFGLLAQAGRGALVAATGGHFAGVVTWRSLASWVPTVRLREISILSPVARWVDDLNAFQPAFLAGYPSALRVLAHEQAAGRLAIAPSIVWSGGEHLGEHARSMIERAFGATVVEEYGCSECPCIAASCARGSLHVNADWVVLEAVDASGRPVPRGALSHTTLITNLANRVQPVIRYDLGDRIVVRDRACECGSPLPAIRVEGRLGDVLTLRRADGRSADILPLAIETALEDEADILRFQVVRRGAREIALRLPAEPPRRRRDTWRRAKAALARLLETQGLENVVITLDQRTPEADPVSGKLVTVVSAREAMAGAAAMSRRRTRPASGPL